MVPDKVASLLREYKLKFSEYINEQIKSGKSLIEYDFTEQTAIMLSRIEKVSNDPLKIDELLNIEKIVIEEEGLVVVHKKGKPFLKKKGLAGRMVSKIMR